MKKLLSIMAALSITSAAATSVVACGDSRDSIGLILSNVTNPYFKTMQTEGEKVAKDLGYKLNVYNSADDPGKEVTNADNAIVKGDKGIILNPNNSETVNAAENIMKKDIPLITVDRGIADKEGKKLGDSSYETNSVEASAQLAELALKYEKTLDGTDGKLNTYVLRGTPGSSASNDRYKGFVENNNDKVVVESGNTFIANFELAQAQKQITSDMSKFGADSKIEAIFAENDEMASGALRALKTSDNGKAWLAKGGIVIGFDGTNEDNINDCEAWTKGSDKQFATAQQDPASMVKQAIEKMVKIIKGEEESKKSYDKATTVDVKILNNFKEKE